MEFVHCVELWNDLYWPDNAQANPQTVNLWSDWLNAGDRVIAIGGSDYHYPPKLDLGLPGERLGQPTSYVYAEGLSETGILEGLRRGSAYVSCGPQENFQAARGGKSFIVGDDLGDQNGEIEFTATISNQPDTLAAQLVRNGHIIAAEQFRGGESKVRFQFRVDRASSSWFRLDVLD